MSEKSVLITGASRGIGAETARLFARQGYAVGINYHRSQAQAQALLEQIQREGGQGALYPADVSSREAVEAMNTITLVDELIQGKPLPAHYILSDKTGETLVIEPDAGGVRIHRNTIGVLTNSPDYRWHRTNLRNFVGVTNLPKAPRTIAGHEIREFGERLGGGTGLPGDYSSPSRFVRIAFMKEYAVRGENEVDGVSRMFRTFAMVDIPEGLAKGDPDYEVYEQTLCTSVLCAESGLYYFAPAQNRRISAVRLLEAGAEARHFPLGDTQDILYRN